MIARLLLATISIAIGGALIIYRKTFTVRGIRQQEKVWGFPLGQRGVQVGQAVAIIVGAGFIVMSVVILLAEPTP